MTCDELLDTVKDLCLRNIGEVFLVSPKDLGRELSWSCWSWISEAGCIGLMLGGCTECVLGGCSGWVYWVWVCSGWVCVSVFTRVSVRPCVCEHMLVFMGAFDHVCAFASLHVHVCVPRVSRQCLSVCVCILHANPSLFPPDRKSTRLNSSH